MFDLVLTYTSGFIIYTVFLIVAVLVISRLEPSKQDYVDKASFFLFGAMAVAFIVFRPIGIVSDDYGYVPKFNDLCPILECGELIQTSRDFAWYTLVAWGKSFSDNPRVMLWLAGMALSIKLAIIYALTARKALALLVYMTMFYIIHDVIAFKVSTAVAVYLIGFYLISIGCLLLGAVALLMVGLFHVQGTLAPLLVLGPWIRPRDKWLNALVLVPLVLVVIGFYPTSSMVMGILDSVGQGGTMLSSIWSQLAEIAKGDPNSSRLVPLVVPPSLLLAVYLYSYNASPKDRVTQHGYFSIGLSSLFLWAFAFNSTAQLRIYHFFFSPIAILVGNIKVNRAAFYCVTTISVIFLIKYNVLHKMIFESRRLTVVPFADGALQGQNAGVTCGDGCYVHKKDNALWLTAVPDTGYRFMGWGSGCVYDREPKCYLTMDQDRTVSPIFQKPVRLELIESNSGHVKSDDGQLDCWQACEGLFDRGSSTTLRVWPVNGYYLQDWVGPCEGIIDCKVNMDQDVKIQATYAPIPRYILLLEKNPNARVVSTPPGIDCGKEADQCFGEFKDVTLRVTLDPGFGFSRWLGCENDERIECRLLLHEDRIIGLELF